MAIPIPPHYDISASPTVAIVINEDWYSVLMGTLDFVLEPEFWEGTDADFEDIKQAILEIMTLD